MASVGALLLLACCSLYWRLILANHHVDQLELDSALTTFSASEAQSFAAPGILEGSQFEIEHSHHPISASNGRRYKQQTPSIPTRSHNQTSSHLVDVVMTQYFADEKWKRVLGEIAEWVLHACIVVLVIFAIYYTVSCICACCIGLDLLKEIWRVLGGWTAFSYFVHVEEAVVETDPPPLPFLRRVAEEP